MEGVESGIQSMACLKNKNCISIYLKLLKVFYEYIFKNTVGKCISSQNGTFTSFKRLISKTLFYPQNIAITSKQIHSY